MPDEAQQHEDAVACLLDAIRDDRLGQCKTQLVHLRTDNAQKFRSGDESVIKVLVFGVLVQGSDGLLQFEHLAVYAHCPDVFSLALSWSFS